jgi:hypothetical protein
MNMKFGFAALTAMLLSSALAQAADAQAPLPGQLYIQIPVPWVPGAGPRRREQWDYDRQRWERCEHLRHQEHEIRERLAYAPPYGDQRRRLEYRLREVHYEREGCEDR